MKVISLSPDYYCFLVLCPRCGSSRLHHIGNSPNYLEVPLEQCFVVSRSKCQICSFVFLNPQPKPLYLASLYELWHERYSADIKSLPTHLKHREAEFSSKHLATIRRFATIGASLLDVGCGNGTFLQVVAREMDIDISGIDISQNALNQVSEKIINAKLYTGRLLEVAHKLKTYDIITMNDYLEHSQSPFADLDLACSRLLNKDGLLFIRVPNQAGILSAIMGKYWYAIIPFHLWYFTPFTITKELESRGMEILYCAAPSYVNYWTYLVGMASYIYEKVAILLGNFASQKSEELYLSGSLEANLVTTNPKRKNIFLSSFRFALGLMVTQLDFLGGIIGRGNDLTIVARKKS